MQHTLGCMRGCNIPRLYAWWTTLQKSCSSKQVMKTTTSEPVFPSSFFIIFIRASKNKPLFHNQEEIIWLRQEGNLFFYAQSAVMVIINRVDLTAWDREQMAARHVTMDDTRAKLQGKACFPQNCLFPVECELRADNNNWFSPLDDSDIHMVDCMLWHAVDSALRHAVGCTL